MRTTKQIFDHHNEFLKKFLLPVLEEPIEGRTATNINDEAYSQPLNKTKNENFQNNN